MNIFKRIGLCVTVVTVMLASAIVYAKITHTVLVFDMKDFDGLPERFRTTADQLPDNGTVRTEGLESVHAAGSQQFSQDTFQHALHHIPAKSVIVIDLRRESHGFLNGDAVSWFGPQNAANAKKSTNQIKISEARLLNRLQNSKFRWVYKIIEKTPDDFIERAERDFVVVNNVQSEQQLVNKSHVGYERYYVEDFHAPNDADVVRFVNFIKNLPNDTWLYFHCRAGRGRTTTFMTMYDMIKNAKVLTFDEIVNRQAVLGGSDLRVLPDKNDFKYQYEVDRLNFIKRFYEYAKANTDNFSTPWTSF